MRPSLIVLASIFMVPTALVAARAQSPVAPPRPPSVEEIPQSSPADRLPRPTPTHLRGAGFRFERDGNKVVFDMRCAASDSSKACADAAAQLIDKLGIASQSK